MRLIILRHGPTEWSVAKRLQGRRDLPLSVAGRALVADWRLDPHWRRLDCWSSPLRRAVETAGAIGFVEPRLDGRLIEMDWGDMEGRTVKELRASLGEEMAENEARGLDFRPSGGESPREVVVRIRELLAHWCERDRSDKVVVTHKGVRRAFISLCTGWDMRRAQPTRLADTAALLVDVGRDGEARLAGERALA